MYSRLEIFSFILLISGISSVLSGKFVLGKYITPLKGKTGIISGNFFINLLYKKKLLVGSVNL